MEVIVFVLAAQSTDQEDSCQTLHEQEVQNVVVLHPA
jgi:hypothetical protein